MNVHIELACWVSLDEEITKGDFDRLLQTIGQYLSFCGGVPQVEHCVTGDMLCITASAVDGKARGSLQDATYIKRAVTSALKAGGMEIT